MASLLSPVLLLGAGTDLPGGAALPLLAGYLRRHGVEAYAVMSNPADPARLAPSLTALLGQVRPRLVGVSLKWFTHLVDFMRLGQIIRGAAPAAQLVVGGNTATWYWRELIELPFIDAIVLGDGEEPLLGLCREERSPPNCVLKRGGRIVRTRRRFRLDAANCGTSCVSHLDEIFLCKKDLHTTGFLVAGRGCSQHCLYCAGDAVVQRRTFGRARPFRRPLAQARRDLGQLAERCFLVAADFDDVAIGGWADYYERLFAEGPHGDNALAFFLSRKIPGHLLERLSSTYARVVLQLDVGCFSERQRRDLQRRGEIRPSLSDEQLFGVLEACDHLPNLEVTLCGVAGLPRLEPADLTAESRFVERLLGHRCYGGLIYNRLHPQPGARVAEAPRKFGMAADPWTYQDYIDALSGRRPFAIPFPDAGLNAAVDETVRAAHAAAAARAEKLRWRPPPGVSPELALLGVRNVTLAAVPCRSYRYSRAEWEGVYALDADAGEVRVPLLVVDAGLRYHLVPAEVTAAGRVLAAFRSPTSVGVASDRLQAAGIAPAAVVRALAALASRGLLSRR